MQPDLVSHEIWLLGCVEGLDALALEISIIDGKALPVIEEPS
jgi:hypothetical protein